MKIQSNTLDILQPASCRGVKKKLLIRLARADHRRTAEDVNDVAGEEQLT